MWRNLGTRHLRTLSPQSACQEARVLPGGEESTDMEGSRDAWTKFRAQDLERCSSVGGEYVLKRQYMELQPPEML